MTRYSNVTVSIKKSKSSNQEDVTALILNFTSAYFPIRYGVCIPQYFLFRFTKMRSMIWIRNSKNHSLHGWNAFFSGFYRFFTMFCTFDSPERCQEKSSASVLCDGWTIATTWECTRPWSTWTCSVKPHQSGNSFKQLNKKDEIFKNGHQALWFGLDFLVVLADSLKSHKNGESVEKPIGFDRVTIKTKLWDKKLKKLSFHHGKTTSATSNPFQVACWKNQ